MTQDGALRFRQASLPSVYDRFLVPKLFEPWARILVDFAELCAGEAVLDVATGPGTVARVAARRVGPAGRVVDIDVSQPMLAVARSKSHAADMAPIDYIESSATGADQVTIAWPGQRLHLHSASVAAA